ncbi:MAG: sensor histidine kinase [Candidatus Limimorpha sp.]
MSSMKNIENKIISLRWLALLSVAISVGMNLAVLLSFWFGDGILFMHDPNYRKPPFHFSGFLVNILYVAVLSFILYILNSCVYRMKSVNNKTKVVIVIVVGIVITMLVSGSMTFFRHGVFNDWRFSKSFSHRFVRMLTDGFFRDFFAMVIVTFSWQLMVLNNKKNKMAVENEMLAAENIRTRFEVLKNQMNPHFMFNCLNTLQGLIAIDKDKAQRYLQELSKVLRYTLNNQEVVTLREELDFTYSYCNLMEIRYGENLKVNFNIDDRMLECEILPLSLQVLIENAIKHNVISDKQHLLIDVDTDFDNLSVIVNNVINRKMEDEVGNGIGLANLSERYELKWGRSIVVSVSENNFKVELTLNKR